MTILNRSFSLLLVLLCVWPLLAQSHNEKNRDLIVEIKSGKIQGAVLKSKAGRDFYAFRGIPYGQSTAGQSRFQPPRPVKSWDGIFDATSTGPFCPQYISLLQSIEGTEDCLVINVYTPKKIFTCPGNELHPVMVFIHGGAFSLGSGSSLMYGPQRFMDQDVILVTLNYRLGILGFLSTEDEISPGNYGMLDQVLALRWVQENIAQFGGDPNRVTIFGESAGSASVIHHLISPFSKGLFHRAIAQSGSSLNHWAIQRKPLHWAKAVAREVNCPMNDSSELVSCLKERNYVDLVKTVYGFQSSDIFPINFAPVVDSYSEDSFLPEDPIVLMKEGRFSNKVPLIIGRNDLEFDIFYYGEVKKPDDYKGTKYLENEFVPVLAMFYDQESYKPETHQVIVQEFFKNRDANNPEVFKTVLIKMLSELSLELGIAQALDLYSKSGAPTWAYKYTHLGEHGLDHLFKVPRGKNATHADELFLQFKFMRFGENLREDDAKMSTILNSLWANFASGRPLSATIDGTSLLWQPYDPASPRYLELNTNPLMKEGSLCDGISFWTQTFDKLALNAPQNRDEL